MCLLPRPRSKPMTKELEFIDLSVSTGEKSLLFKARGALRAGELVAVVGRSGSGKTLLTKAIIGLLPQQLRAEGQILLDGQRLDQLGEKAMDSVRGRRISMLFQQPKRVMNPRLTIRAHLLEALGARGWNQARKHEDQVLSLLAGENWAYPLRILPQSARISSPVWLNVPYLPLLWPLTEFILASDNVLTGFNSQVRGVAAAAPKAARTRRGRPVHHP